MYFATFPVHGDEVLFLKRLLPRRHQRSCAVRLHVTTAETGGDAVNYWGAWQGEAAERVDAAYGRYAGHRGEEHATAVQRERTGDGRVERERGECAERGVGLRVREAG